MIFSERLRYLIDSSEINIKDLASELGLSPSALGNYVRGYREPDFEILVRIAGYFQVTTDYLLGYDNAAQAGGQGDRLMSLWRKMTAGQKELTLEQMELISNYRITK